MRIFSFLSKKKNIAGEGDKPTPKTEKNVGHETEEFQSEIVFHKKDVQGNQTWEIYLGSNAKKAKEFLNSKSGVKPGFNILVQTEEGNWGRDVDGLYLTNLLEWQKNLALKEVDGRAMLLPEFMRGAELNKKGLCDNFVCKIICGDCRAIWFDGIRVDKPTIVKCAECGKYNEVEANVMFV